MAPETSNYVFRSQPYAHQMQRWLESRDRQAYACAWDPGTGKTKLLIDTFGWLAQEGRVGAMLVVAPNGVHRNWREEIRDHLPASLQRRCVVHTYDSSTSATRRAIASLDEMMRSELAVLAISYHGLMTDDGAIAAKKLLQSRPTLYVVDESHRIKSPSAKWSQRVQKSGKLAAYRRIATGTFIANSPFDAYMQMKFLLGEDAWIRYGIRTFAAFKAHFGVFQEVRVSGGRPFMHCVAYRNLEQIQALLKEHGSVVKKEEAIDLPPKVYTRRYFEITPAQRRVYDTLREECEVLLDEGRMTAELAIVRLLRFRQIVSDVLIDENDQVIRLVKGTNPRLAALKEVVEDLEDDALFIVWCQFRQEVEDVMGLLEAMKIPHAAYTGETKMGERVRILRDAANRDGTGGKLRAIVATPASMGEGVTLTRVTAVIYYSNGYKLTERLQSEDRAHRIGQTKSVLYVDLIAEGTVDERILDALRSKRNIAAEVTGESLKEWI